MDAEATRTHPVLREIVNRIRMSVHPEKIILFGSRADGHETEQSDFDVLVVKETSRKRVEAMKIYRALVGAGVPVDIVVATPGDLIRHANSLVSPVAAALREGVVLYAAG